VTTAVQRYHGITHTYGANKKISRGPNRQDKQNENEGERKREGEKKGT
jgi:hypothetical protein